ncbi:Plus-3 [Cynara cardunculus var. scolymus]|uniref:Plus-3 n=1 Tax=Cynara cardunculus var. scolymus TaxID=59895 RepID=A0A103XBF7_CYNCS|nr:Plus-3 [Cynara cardunculus var. scolymus]
MKKRARTAWKKEDYSEEWCFVCKDGGELIICDQKDCFKSYHPECVELDDSSAKAKNRFICDLHRCETCSRTSDVVQCYCCPKGVCRRCIKSADFVHVKGKKGFCEHCLKLTLLVEEKKDVDSDGEMVDFNNRNTYETLYKEYWEIINATEKLTLEDLTSAKAQLKSGKNYDSDKYDDSDEYQCSDYEEKDDDMEPHDSGKKIKRSKPEPSEKTDKTKGKAKGKAKGKTKSTPKSKKKEFTDWGSTRLMQFLTNIGKETVHALSQRELEKIIKGYSKEKNLIQKNKMVECDAWLQSIFGRKTVKLNRIYDLLESHLAENQVSSDEDELGYDSEDMDQDDEDLVVNKRKKKNSGDKISEKKEAVLDVANFHFASIVPENIRLVYLRRSLVQKLEQEPETFESKVIGSFVRVKEDVSGCFSKSYQLVQVTGIKKCLGGENGQTFVLQALETDISITLLSDDEFSEEECEDLKKKVKSGILKKLTLVGVEEKAKSLHKDIVTHWIPRELALLKHRIDQANEKGWRKEYPF